MWDSIDALEAHRKTLGSQVSGVEAELRSQISGVEADLQQVQQHTKKLDTYINDMLKQMLGTLNQGESCPSSACPIPPVFIHSPCSPLSLSLFLLGAPHPSPPHLLHLH